MTISISEAVSDSFDWVKVTLFERFAWQKWFVLGFAAFLAYLGEGGGSGGAQNAVRFMNGSSDKVFEQAAQWLTAHLTGVILFGSGLLVIGWAFAILFMWLSSHGKFLFLNGVVRDEALISKPWREYADESISLLLFRILLGFGSFVLLLPMIVIGVLSIIKIAKNKGGAGVLGMTVSGLLAGGCFFILVIIAIAIIKFILEDFVIPIMFLKRIKTVAAFRVFKNEVLPGRFGTLCLYVILKIVFGFAAVIIIMIITLLTCCIAGLPYISSVVFLPILVFFRVFPVFILQQMGDEWRFFPKGWKDEAIKIKMERLRRKRAPAGSSESQTNSLPSGDSDPDEKGSPDQE